MRQNLPMATAAQAPGFSANPDGTAGPSVEALGLVTIGPMVQRAPPDGYSPEVQSADTPAAGEAPPAAGAPPAAAAGAAAAAGEPDIERLADRVWQVVRRKLALERERRHGLP